MAVRSLPVPQPRRRLSDLQRLAWLQLLRSENVGPVTFREIVNHYGGAEQALAALPELSRRGGRGRPIRIARREEAEAEIVRAARHGAHLTAVDEPGYPPLLAALEAPPPLVYVKGRIEVLDRPSVAIVGSRDASAAGRKLTRQIAADLGVADHAVVSGLARGIDQAAHEASLASGTVAVLAGGIDVVYPPEHDRLQAEIGEMGVLIAESAPGLEPRGRDFPRRNRIISGIALGVLVVEAARRSGSRITANFALEQGREVFAVPGNPLDPRAEGTNQLIKDGATLVTEAADILAVLAPIVGAPSVAVSSWSEAEVPAEPTLPPEVDEPARAVVLGLLGAHPVSLDELTRESGLDIRSVRVVLLELDLAGRLERMPGNRVALRLEL